MSVLEIAVLICAFFNGACIRKHINDKFYLGAAMHFFALALCVLAVVV